MRAMRPMMPHRHRLAAMPASAVVMMMAEIVDDEETAGEKRWRPRPAPWRRIRCHRSRLLRRHPHRVRRQRIKLWRPTRKTFDDAPTAIGLATGLAGGIAPLARDRDRPREVHAIGGRRKLRLGGIGRSHHPVGTGGASG